MLHHVVIAGLVYILIGSFGWIVLDGLGYVEMVFQSRAARGASNSALAWSLTSLMMIVCWPLFVWSMMRGRRRA